MNSFNTIKEAIKKAKAPIKIVVTGHACDFAGSEEYNLQLSDKRAKQMAEWIIHNTGIKEDDIIYFGCGTSRKVCDGGKEAQSANRRAEVYIVQ